ncbi:MAG: ribosome biogenesis GTPase YlqF [Lachnospiraceae bacterium]|nr:ribosome biogenesis GTPase YlqF [Lachnospiraceae bacterium]
MNIQWYPGHMTKAKRMMQEDIKLIDLVIEILDARLPKSSRNPDIDELGKNKARLIVLNKADLADEAVTEEWKQWFESKQMHVITVNARSGAGIRQMDKVIQEACKEKIERDRKRGILNRPIRAMVAGIPNVGKSTLINGYAGKACTKTGNKPGVTKGKQWIKMSKTLELLDTPGILWPKFEDPEAGLRLAFVGTINDQIIQTEELALEFIRFMEQSYPGVLKERYYPQTEPADTLFLGAGSQYANEITILNQIALSRSCKKKGDEPDLEKAAAILFDDFRQGKLGKITLERPVL